ncbi:Uncharacterised protein [Fusobacterium necrophorum subsp. necrophorum]|nr:Uncharacterised protein [Fusobacterium necrophorum subsp. necrophorum]
MKKSVGNYGRTPAVAFRAKYFAKKWISSMEPMINTVYLSGGSRNENILICMTVTTRLCYKRFKLYRGSSRAGIQISMCGELQEMKRQPLFFRNGLDASPCPPFQFRESTKHLRLEKASATALVIES